jgi:hypothetical protein
VAIYIYAQVKSGPIHGGGALSKRVWVRIDRHSTQVTLREVHDKIKQIQEEHPDLDVFWDGDEYAICSREKTRPSEEKSEEMLIESVK